ncbi:MAG TPA: class I SAM-dependent methyltransferase [Jatrophihabitans sp.]|jgi:SAM-dependent methyltransferase|uniref:class I SAM-dependent methyltransferase n=1 Tax=Jatrophihabitans sp. TaxID=1932789 RepID=UPI002DF9A130|nr:class I SAM-dependent methyltransferase [Jatrophihabitans sp.]
MPHPPSHPHDHAATGTGLTALLDLDGQALHEYWTAALGWVERAVRDAGVTPRRIVDLGAGSGLATVLLAERFPDADVLAIDVSDEMVEHIRGKATAHGLTRVRVEQADLDGAWPEAGPLDLVWASMSLHHLADPERVLGDVRASLRPGGLVAVAEFDEPLRFLPDDLGLGEPGLERRCLDVMAEVHARDVPELGADWPARLARAGFEAIEARPFAIELTPPSDAVTNRYALRWMQRLAVGVGEALDEGDRATLAALVGDGPASIGRRDDIHVRGLRTVTLARRPA